MVAVNASAHRVVAVLAALVVATSIGTQSADAAENPQTGVKRLWSQFPLGPQLRTHARTHTRRQPPPPSTSAQSDRAATSSRTNPSGSQERRYPRPWMAALIASALAIAIAVLAWLRRPPSTPTPRARGEPPPHEIRGLQEREPAAGIESSGASDRELVHYAAVYAAACRAGNPAPILAVAATVSPTTGESGAYSSQMVAEARRRGLLTSHGDGKPGGELTARAKALLSEAESPSPGPP